MIKKFNQYIKEDNTGDRHLLYYAFDWDDNILNMTTVIHMEHLIDGEWLPEDVSTSKFAEVRSDKDNWRILGNDPEQAFSEFRDNGPRGQVAFLEDVKDSISNKKFGPKAISDAPKVDPAYPVCGNPKSNTGNLGQKHCTIPRKSIWRTRCAGI